MMQLNAPWLKNIGDVPATLSYSENSIYDAVAVATTYALKEGVFNIHENYEKKYVTLLKNEEFKTSTKSRTTNIANIRKRISLAAEILYGVKYEG